MQRPWLLFFVMLCAVSTKATPHASQKPYQPHRVLWLFGAAALVLIPWTVWLSHALPNVHLDRRWGIAWSGLDAAEFIALALTVYLGVRKSGWIIVAATIAGTLLFIDAWFDCLTAAAGWEYAGSLASALFVELPLSFIAFTVAYRVGKTRL